MRFQSYAKAGKSCSLEQRGLDIYIEYANPQEFTDIITQGSHASSRTLLVHVSLSTFLQILQLQLKSDHQTLSIPGN